jgi:hypothetical protein
MKPWNPLAASLWPTADERLLLRAALGADDEALCAWREWRAQHEVAAADPAARALLPQAYFNLARHAVAPDDRAALSATYRETWVRNQIAFNRLLAVLRRFAAAAVPAMVLKGVPLALYYYRDAGARTMADVDVLIRSADLPRAAAVLEAEGWRATRPLPPPAITPIVRALEWTRPQGLSLDLHWRPFTVDCPLDVEDQCWQRADTRELRGVPITVPCAEDLLLLMCFHGRRQDRQAAGRWVADALVVIATANPPIDWSALLARSRETGLQLPVWDALRYLQREFKAPVPSDLVAQAEGIAASAADHARYRELVHGDRAEFGLSEVIANHWWRYSSYQRSHGGRPTVRGFACYYVTFKRWEWQLQGGASLARRVLAAVLRRWRSGGL